MPIRTFSEVVRRQLARQNVDGLGHLASGGGFSGATGATGSVAYEWPLLGRRKAGEYTMASAPAPSTFAGQQRSTRIGTSKASGGDE